MIFDDKKFINGMNEKLKNKNLGGVVSFVTDTVWGVGCLPSNEKGVENIYELKNRDRSKPLILMSDRVEHLLPYVKNIPEKAHELMEKHFPGALTLIFEKSDLTPLFMTSNKNTVGIRVPANPVFKRLCEVVEGHVLATTSANLSGQKAASNYDEAVKNVGEHVEYVFEDYGFHCQGLASTVALALDDDIKVLRQGEVVIE
ncbi:MAG: threonylcarbamoyl-AMP synthase [Clostridium sp.]|nr:threonylcarbamoyl-AMP synthase [Clostridium sp.]